MPNLIVSFVERERDIALAKVQGKATAAALASGAISAASQKGATSIGGVSAAVALDREREREANSGGCLASGLTPPTQDIVKRKFELTRKTEGYPAHIIRTVMDDVRRPLTPMNLFQRCDINNT